MSIFNEDGLEENRILLKDDIGFDIDFYSAFTSQELEELIRQQYNEYGQGWDSCRDEFIFWYGNKGACTRVSGCVKETLFIQEETIKENESVMRAEVLIYLLENGKNKGTNSCRIYQKFTGE